MVKWDIERCIEFTYSYLFNGPSLLMVPKEEVAYGEGEDSPVLDRYVCTHFLSRDMCKALQRTMERLHTTNDG